MANSVSTMLVATLTVLVSVSAHAHPETAPNLGETVKPLPPTYKAGDVTVDEHPNAQVPLDAAFRTPEGTQVTLREVLASTELPTILTFNYSDCPMLCSLQLNGLVTSLPPIAVPVAHDGKQIAFRPGEQYRIVTIDLESNESLAKLGALRDRYIGRLPADQQGKARAGGWTFLAAAVPGDAKQIARVAETVGFKYTYLPDKAEYAHPAALIFLSSTGKVIRYVYGIEFGADVMRESILAAGTAEPKAAAGFMLRCYHFDPGANDHSRAGVLALRVGATGFIVLLVGLGAVFLVRSRKATEAVRS